MWSLTNATPDSRVHMARTWTLRRSKSEGVTGAWVGGKKNHREGPQADTITKEKKAECGIKTPVYLAGIGD